MQVLSVVTVMLAPLAGLLLVASSSFSWSRIESDEAMTTLLRAHFTLAEGCLRVRFLPDGRSRGRQMREPLRIPWIPLADLVEGPPAVAQFRRQLLRPNQRVDALGAHPGERDMEFVVQNLERSRKCSEWDPTFFRPLDTTSLTTELSKNGALAFLAAAWLSQMMGLLLLRHSRPGSWRPLLVLRLSGCLYLFSSAVCVAGLTHYSAVCRHRLKVLVSEFVLGISGGDVVLWPQDLTLHLATGAHFMLCSALMSFLLGMYQISGEFFQKPSLAPNASSENVGKVHSEVRRLSTPQVVELQRQDADDTEAEQEESAREREDREFFLKALDVTKGEIKAHNRRVAGTVIMAMLAFVILLCAVAFFFGRVAVAQGIQNALRGPQLSVKQTTLSFRKAKESARDLVVGAGNVTVHGLSTAGHQTYHGLSSAQRGLAEYSVDAKRRAREVADALRSPDWRQVLWNILLLPGRLAIQGLGAIYQQLMHNLRLLHHSCVTGLQHSKRAMHRCWKHFRMRQLQQHTDSTEAPKPVRLRWPWQKSKNVEVPVEEQKWWKRILPKKQMQKDSEGRKRMRI